MTERRSPLPSEVENLRRHNRLRAESTLALVRAAVAKAGGTYLEGSYSNGVTPFRFLCKCGAPASARWGNVQQRGNKLVCRTCSLLERPKGSEHPNWDLSITDRTKRIHLSTYKEWERSVKTVADFTCLISGVRGGTLSSHHLYSYGRYPHLQLDLSNGVCISRELHREFHSFYGRKDTTFPQFQEFFQTKTGRSCPISDPWRDP